MRAPLEGSASATTGCSMFCQLSCGTELVRRRDKTVEMLGC
jgi:hypothetical protein